MVVTRRSSWALVGAALALACATSVQAGGVRCATDQHNADMLTGVQNGRWEAVSTAAAGLARIYGRTAKHAHIDGQDLSRRQAAAAARIATQAEALQRAITSLQQLDRPALNAPEAQRILRARQALATSQVHHAVSELSLALARFSLHMGEEDHFTPYQCPATGLVWLESLRRGEERTNPYAGREARRPGPLEEVHWTALRELLLAGEGRLPANARR